jgi:hypothetical protein
MRKDANKCVAQPAGVDMMGASTQQRRGTQMYTVKVRKWEDAVAMAVAKRGAYRTVDGGYVVIWEPKQQQKGA